MENYLPLIIQSIIVGGVGYMFTSAVGKVNTKLDLVLKNQENHRVQMTAIEKDVQSNKEWSKDNKIKVDKHEIIISKLRTDLAGLMAKQK